MDANLLGHVFDHHRAQSIYAVLQELRLAADDGLAGAQNGALPLLDITDELQSRTIALLDVLLHLPLGIGLRQQLAVALIQPQGRHVLLVHDDNELIAALDKDDIGLDKPCLGSVVALARTRIETSDKIDSLLQQLLLSGDG